MCIISVLSDISYHNNEISSEYATTFLCQENDFFSDKNRKEIVVLFNHLSI